jgi:hypothetical protein
LFVWKQDKVCFMKNNLWGNISSIFFLCFSFLTDKTDWLNASLWTKISRPIGTKRQKQEENKTKTEQAYKRIKTKQKPEQTYKHTKAKQKTEQTYKHINLEKQNGWIGKQQKIFNWNHWLSYSRKMRKYNVFVIYVSIFNLKVVCFMRGSTV